jgi:hypothetical protein
MTLFDQPGDPMDALAASTIPIRAVERRIYDLISGHRGHANPISIDSLHRITGMSERAIKATVAELIVTHRVLIGASRQDPIGYFVIETDADRAVASEPLKGQVIQMLRRLRVLNGTHQTREWLGQQVIEP